MQNVSLVSLSASCAFKVKYSSILLVKEKKKTRNGDDYNCANFLRAVSVPSVSDRTDFLDILLVNLAFKKRLKSNFFIFLPKWTRKDCFWTSTLSCAWIDFFFFAFVIVCFPSVWHQNKAAASTNCHTAEGCFESEAVKSLLLFSVRKPWIVAICSFFPQTLAVAAGGDALLLFLFVLVCTQ